MAFKGEMHYTPVRKTLSSIIFFFYFKRIKYFVVGSKQILIKFV
ncbi:hypothetical protein PP101_26 [Pectobacterium phage PP101]|uniref:Uncharacterized protein n=1 Tax=Pectobacterium phage PP101 TaxID=1916414 RepID=A0A2R4UKE7_9CAUD|nr:hypothetical protein HOR42_gp26 [Pectobacterium phage PP101]AWA42533.1 hypothetical protein PP101_26 [Pectobacterium phage PP101]